MSKPKKTALIVGLSVAGLCLALWIGGCVAVVVRSWGPGSPGGPSDSESSLPQTSEARLNGMTVDDYGPMLLDRDVFRSHEGAVALAGMGPESLRWFLKGMRSDVPHVQGQAFGFLPAADAAKYKGVFEPVLLKAFDDPGLRRQAGLRLVEIHSDRGTARVRAMLDDPTLDAQTKHAWTAALGQS